MEPGQPPLPSRLEVAALVRQVQSIGDFATVLKTGDPDRGTLLLLLTSRGRHLACLERQTGLDGSPSWRRTGPGEDAGSVEIAEFLETRTCFDPDFWAIELDVVNPQRFTDDIGLIG